MKMDPWKTKSNLHHRTGCNLTIHFEKEVVEVDLIPRKSGKERVALLGFLTIRIFQGKVKPTY